MIDRSFTFLFLFFFYHSKRPEICLVINDGRRKYTYVYFFLNIFRHINPTPSVRKISSNNRRETFGRPLNLQQRKRTDERNKKYEQENITRSNKYQKKLSIKYLIPDFVLDAIVANKLIYVT